MSDQLNFKLTDDVSWETMDALHGRVVVLEDGRWFKAFMDWSEIAERLDVEYAWDLTDEQCEKAMHDYAELLIEAHLMGDIELELHSPAEGPYGPVFNERFYAAA